MCLSERGLKSIFPYSTLGCVVYSAHTTLQLRVHVFAKGNVDTDLQYPYKYISLIMYRQSFQKYCPAHEVMPVHQRGKTAP